MAGKKCAICGSPSGLYPLCSKCFRLREAGEVVQCSCKAWYKVADGCECGAKPVEVSKPIKAEPTNKDTVMVDSEKPLTECILCKKESKGKLFCAECYRKYNNKVLFLQITNCKEIKLQEVGYEGKHTCKDGHIVKSKSEMTIDEYLYNKDIKHAYEPEIIIDIDLNKTMKPDFFLPELDVYIEHWGIEGNDEYEKKKNYKIEQYKKMGATVICTYEKDMSNPSARLEYKLDPTKFKIGIINFLTNN